MIYDRNTQDAMAPEADDRDHLTPDARKLVEYWEVASEALIRAGIEPERARRLAYEGIVLALSCDVIPATCGIIIIADQRP